jgi:hypothetical protein
MKLSKRIKASLQALESKRGKIKLSVWLETQPSSTRKGVKRGTFQLPSYVLVGE